MSGIPWGVAKIGGFVTDDDWSEEFQELMIRWYQYGVFTPVFRTHGKRGNNNNEPWNLGGDTYKHIKQCLRLREALRPYIRQQMELATSKGIPPMRPMLFDFPNQEQLYDIRRSISFWIRSSDCTNTSVQDQRKKSLPTICMFMDKRLGK